MYYHNQSINYYKQYTYIYNIKFNNKDLDRYVYKNVPVFQCNDNTNNFENSILDSATNRYLTHFQYQKEKFNFYQTICQPLNISDDFKKVTFYNGQRFGNQSDDVYTQCMNGKGDKSNKDYNYIVNTGVNKKIKYTKDIYLPKFLGDKYISYHHGIVEGLNTENPIDNYKKLIINEKVQCPPPPEEGDLDIDKQINKIEKLRKKLILVINKEFNIINRLKLNISQNELDYVLKNLYDKNLSSKIKNIFKILGINQLETLTNLLKYNCSYNFKKETINIKCK